MGGEPFKTRSEGVARGEGKPGNKDFWGDSRNEQKHLHRIQQPSPGCWRERKRVDPHPEAREGAKQEGGLDTQIHMKAILGRKKGIQMVNFEEMFFW